MLINNNYTRISKSLAIGFGLLSIAFLLPVIQSILFDLGIEIMSWIFPAAYFLSLSITFCLTKSLKPTLWILCYSVLCLLLSYMFFDRSFDGQGYHQEIIALINNGWNPADLEKTPDNAGLWALHYSKAVEIGCATIVDVFGSIETGKLYNFIMLGAVFCFVYSILIKRLSTKYTILFSSLLTLNPVTLCQLLTFYIDFYAYCYVLILLCAIYMLTASQTNIVDGWIGWSTICFIIILSYGTKLTAFYLAGITLIGWFLWLMVKKNHLMWKLVVFVSLSLILSLFIFYHPYITNYLTHGNPFYPLTGTDSVDIMSGNTPDIYNLFDNRIANFFISIFTPALPGIDSRAGAFGPLFGIAFILTVYSMIRYRKELDKTQYYVLAIIFLSCFSFHQSWWGRYNPQIWLLPSLTALFIFNAHKKMSIIISVICLLNIASCIPKQINTVAYSISRSIIYETLNDTVYMDYIYPQIAYKLDYYQIPYKSVENIDSALLMDITSTGTTVQLKENEYEKITDRFNNGNVVERMSLKLKPISYNPDAYSLN